MILKFTLALLSLLLITINLFFPTLTLAYELTPELAQKYNISFPIQELNNCNDCGSCNNFCSKPENKNTCESFVQKTGLVNEETQFKAEIFDQAKQSLGCDSEASCQKFCSSSKNQDKCQEFIEKNNLDDEDFTKGVEPPLIISDFQNKPINDQQVIKLKGEANALAEVYLQPISRGGNLVFVGRRSFNSQTGQVDVDLNSLNYPNGDYKLIAKTVKNGETSLTASVTEIKIDNSSTGASVDDIIFPSDFDAEITPVSADTKVDTVKNVTLNEPALQFTGTSTPNTIINLLIFSNPIVVTVKTDANGTWVYNLEKPLEPGKHIAYVAVNDKNQGQVRSEVASFIIAPVLAAEGNQESLILESATTNNIFNQFIMVTGIIILISILLLFIMFFLKKKALNIKPTNEK